jgi:hypothetical protein
MSKQLLAVIAFAAGAAALSGCVVVPAYPGYGYGYGYRRGGPPPAVIVTPGPDYRYQGGYYPRPRW